MADFEDANTPTWMNVVAGQRNMIDAVERTITYDSRSTDATTRCTTSPRR